MSESITDHHSIDPNDIISLGLNKSFHLTLEGKVCSDGTLIFIAEKNTEYTKYMNAHAPCLDDGDMVDGFDTDLTAIFPHPINDYLRLGTLAESIYHPSMQFYIMSFDRGYNPDEVIKKIIKEHGDFRTTIEIVPISEEDSHGV